MKVHADVKKKLTPDGQDFLTDELVIQVILIIIIL